jgi:hypothetical protein
MWKLLWSIWLLTLLGIFGGGVPVAASTVWSGSMWFTFHYDGQTQGGPAYDGASPRVLDYDSAAVPIADGKENRTARTGDAFPNFAEFPAAETEVTALTKFYPENAGFAGATEQTFLMPGQTIDRYGGSGYSRFFSPQGTADWARSLPPGTAGQPLRTF